MRITPNQYFEEETLQKERVEILPETGVNYTLYFIIISIIAGVALGLGIAALSKK